MTYRTRRLRRRLLLALSGLTLSAIILAPAPKALDVFAAAGADTDLPSDIAPAAWGERSA